MEMIPGLRKVPPHRDPFEKWFFLILNIFLFSLFDVF